MRRRYVLTILLLVVTVSVPALAQQRWGRGHRPRSGACFYRHTHFRGDYFCMTEGERWNSLPPGYNDKISSINVYGGARLRIFKGRNFSGDSVLIDRDIRNLRSIPLPGNVFKNWNNRVSSIAVFRDRDEWARPAPNWRRWGRPARPRSGACFYRHANFRGDYFCIRSGEHWAALPRGMNDRISSIAVFGRARVRIFRDSEFAGPSRLVFRDLRHLRRWNNRISSIVVFGGRHRRYPPRRDRDYDRDRDRNYDRDRY